MNLEQLLIEQNPELSDTPVEQAKRGAAGEVSTGLVRSAVVQTPTLVGQGMKYFSEPGAPIYEAGESLRSNAQIRGENPELRLQPEAHGAITNSLAAGAEMLVPSVGPQTLALLGDVLFPPGAPAFHAAAAGMTGVGFGAAQAQDSYERVLEATGDKGKARLAGMASGTIEGGGEALGSLIAGKYISGALRFLGPKTGGRVVEQVLAMARKPKALAQFGKATALNVASEVGTEMGQNAGEVAVERAAGVTGGPTPGEAAVEAISPTLGMSALMLPLGGVGAYRANRQTKLMLNALEDAAAPIEARSKAAAFFHNEIAQTDQADADRWAAETLAAIGEGKALSVVEPTAVTAAVPVAAQAAPKPAGPLSKAAGMAPRVAAAVPVAPAEDIPLPPEPGESQAPVTNWSEHFDRELESLVDEPQNEGSVSDDVSEVRQEVGGAPQEVPAVRGGNQGESYLGFAGYSVTESDPGGYFSIVAPDGQTFGRYNSDAKRSMEEQRAGILAHMDNAGAKGMAPTPLDAQAHEAATSPSNDRPEPTAAQIEAGNYKVGRIKLHGLDISVENPAGSTRKGTDETGRQWATDLVHHYGYLKGTVGRDKDHVDVFIKPGIDQSTAGDKVFVVDQVDPKTGKLDEHKVLFGFASLDEARKGYLANYDQSGPQRIGAITESGVDEFKVWLKEGNTHQAFAGSQQDPVAAVAVEPEGKAETSVMEQKYQELFEVLAEAGYAEGDELNAEGRALIVRVGKEKGHSWPKSGVAAEYDPLIEAVRQKLASEKVSEPSPAAKPLPKADDKPAALSIGDRFEWDSMDWEISDLDGGYVGAVDPDTGSFMTWDSYAKFEQETGQRVNMEAANQVAKPEVAQKPAKTEDSSQADHLDKLRAQAIDNLAGEREAAAKDPNVFTADVNSVVANAPLATEAGKILGPELGENDQYMLGMVWLKHGSLGQIEIAKRDLAAQRKDKEARRKSQAEAKKAEEKPKEKVTKGTALGENANGKPLFADAYGNRYYNDSGVQVNAPVLFVPGKSPGIKSAAELFKAGSTDFLTSAELAAFQPKKEPAKPKNTDSYGGSNKLVSKDRAEELRAKLRAKLNNLNSGVDPELISLGTELAVYHIEAGARSFVKFSRKLVSELGESAKPFLKSWYMGAKYFPGLNTEGMDGAATIEALNVDDIVDGVVAEAENSDKVESGKEGPENDRVDETDQGQPLRNDREGTAGTGDSASARVEPEAAQGADAEQAAAADHAEGGGAGAQGNKRTHGGRVPKARGGRSRAARVHSDPAGSRLDSEDRGGRDLEPQEIPGSNYRIPADFELGRGEAAKYSDNLAAVRILKTLRAQGRLATAAEQAALSRYVGWGGLANAFRKPDGSIAKGWETKVAEVEELLTENELEVARNSTQFAHYTSKAVVDGVWQIVQRLGFAGGNVLEPAMGTGNFLGMAPEAIAGRSHFTGVEYDPLTAGIADALYPQSNIIKSGFEKVPVPPNYFDLVVGNPPFSQSKLQFKYTPDFNRFSMHNQFMMAGIEALKPGGIQVFVVSRYFMDAKGGDARAKIAEQANLIGAFRLPDSAFKANAGTEVITDIIILQKKTESLSTPAVPGGPSVMVKDSNNIAWGETKEVADPLGGDPITVNEYFADHPQNIIGTLDRSGSQMHGNDVNVHLAAGLNITDELDRRIQSLPENIAVEETPQERSTQAFKALQASIEIALRGGEVGNVVLNAKGELSQIYERDAYGGGELLAERILTEDSPWHNSLQQNKDGQWFEIIDQLDKDGKPVKVKDSRGKDTKRNAKLERVYASESELPASRKLGALGYTRLKDAVRVLDSLITQINLENTQAASDKDIERNRKELRRQYEAFISAHGYMNSGKLSGMIGSLPNGALLRSLEAKYKPEITPLRAKTLGVKPRAAIVKTADILNKRIVYPYQAPTSAESANDALAVVLSEAGGVDIARIAELTGQSKEQVIDELHTAAATPVIFNDPETGRWETADEYLGGNVVRKLEAARQADVQKNIEALEKVQPEPWTADKVTVTLGATWVPESVYSDFVQHLTGASGRVLFSRLTNTFSVRGQSDTTGALLWNTPGRNVVDLLGNILNSQSIKVTYRDEQGATHVNHEATQAANDMAETLKEEFTEWVFKDSDRRQVLVELFNRKFNVRVTKQRSGAHLKFPGKVPDHLISLRRHQVNGIWRGIVDRFVLYDHAVGAGKTFTAIARAMERRRMGLSKKPMMVVPNHILEQVAKDVYALYPGAKILAAGTKDLSKDKRKRLFARIATGDWDLVIVPHSSFQFIGISPDTEERYLQEELSVAIKAVKEAEEEAAEEMSGGWRKPLTVKEAERLRDTIQARLDKVRQKSGQRDNLLTFEQMGVDDLTVDESHEFKNLFYNSRLNVRGMNPKAGSGKAYDLWSKVRVLRDSKHGSVAFMTGTPISNSAVELYGIMRYLAADSLQEMGLEHFDAWRSQFATVTSAYEPKDSGRGLKEVNRIGRDWSNMRSLMDLYYSFADAVSNEDIKTWYAEDNDGAQFPLPKVKGGGRSAINVEPSAVQESIIEGIVQGFEGLPGITDINLRNAERLRLMDRARKVSLDARAVDPSLADNGSGGKLERVAIEVKRIYDATTKDRGTQLLFLDRSVPKAKGDAARVAQYDSLVRQLEQAEATGNEADAMKLGDQLEKYDANEMAELKAAQQGGWNAYDEIKKNLIMQGVAADEIKFVQEAATDDQKKALFEEVNSGKVRVLLGSTPKMGAGTNVQERLVGLHHVDVTWKPSDIEQREGRIIRQGNGLLDKYGDKFEVEIIAYTTNKTVDAKLWSLNATKLKMINGLRHYTGDFNIEFDDSDSVGMSEIAAIASGEPLQLERVQLSAEIDKLGRQKKAHQRRMWGVEDELTQHYRALENEGMSATLDKYAGIHREIEQRAAQRTVTVDGQTFGFREAAEAKAAITAAWKRQQEQAKDGKETEGKFVVTVNGKKFTGKTKALDAVQGALGDAVEFEARFDGQTFISRLVMDKAIAKRVDEVIQANRRGEEMEDTPVGSVSFGDLEVHLSAQVSVGGRLGGDEVVVEVFAEAKDGETWIVRDNTVGALGLGGTNTTEAVRGISSGMARQVRDITGNAQNARVKADKAREFIPKLKEMVNEPFAKDQELSDKTGRLAEVEAELAAAAEPATEEAPKFLAQKGSVGRVRLSDVEFDAIFKRITGGIKDPAARNGFVVKATASELPARILAEIKKQGNDPNDIDGVFHRGKVYLVQENITSAERLEEVLFHEWHGHAGLFAMFGNDGATLKAAMVDLYNTVTPGRLYPIGRKYGINLMQYGQALAKGGYDLDTRRAIMAEEMLAFLTQEYSKGTIARKVREVIGQVRAWLRKRGFAKLAKWGETDIAFLLKRARMYADSGAWAKEGSAVPISGQEILARLRDAGISEEMLTKLLAGVPRFAAAYHGSPHDFDKFSTSAIGTGEGAQAYGYGLYFAGQKSIAEWYKEKLTRRDSQPRNYAVQSPAVWKTMKNKYPVEAESIEQQVQASYATVGATANNYDLGYAVIQEALGVGSSNIPEGLSDEEMAAIEAVAKEYAIRVNDGKLYHVELAPAEDEYLLWDRPLSEQSEKVKAALSNYGYDGQETSGEEIYRNFAGGSIRGRNAKMASDDLHSLGIRGIKYLDGTSRGKGEGAYNYVIFDDADVEITAKFAVNPEAVKAFTQKLTPDNAGLLFKTLSGVLPERMKAAIGGVLSNPHYGSRKSKHRTAAYDMALERGANANEIKYEVMAKNEGYEGLEGTRDYYRQASKEEKAQVDKLLVEGDIQGAEYTETELDGSKNPLGQAVPAVVKKAYLAFRQTLAKSTEVMFDRLGRLRLLPYENTEYYQELIDLLDENLSKAEVERRFGINQKAVDAYYQIRQGKAKLDAATKPYRTQAWYDTLRDALVKGLSAIEMQHEFGKTPDLVQAHQKIMREGFPRISTAEQYRKAQWYKTLADLLSVGDDHPMLQKLELYNAYLGVMEYDSQLARLKEQWRTAKGYLPRIRKDGEQHVKVYQVEADGTFTEVWMQPAKTVYGAEKLREKVAANVEEYIPHSFDPNAQYEVAVEPNMSTPEEIFLGIGSHRAIEALLSKVFDKATDAGIIENQLAVQQQVLRILADEISTRGFGRHRLSRSEHLIEGYETENTPAILSQFVGGMAGWLSKSEFAMRANKLMSQIPATAPSDKVWVRQYVDDALKNSTYIDQWFGTARSFAALMFLGFKASSAMLNATQNYIWGQARLSVYAKGATRKLLAAQRDVVKDHLLIKAGKVGVLSAEERWVMEEGLRRGRSHANYVRSMAGMDDNGGVLGAGQAGLRWLTEKAMAPFQMVETYWNREPALLAAYRVFKAQGMDQHEALKQAERFVDDVHFVVGKENIPAMLRKMGPMGRTLYTFQSYTHNYLLGMLTSLGKGEFEVVARSLTALVLFGGLAAMPFGDDLDKWYRRIFGERPLRMLEKWLRETAGEYTDFGDQIADFVIHGAPALAGVNFSNSIAVNMPWLSPDDESLAERVTGVWGGLAQKVRYAGVAASKGDLYRATEFMAPEALANILRAYRLNADGTTTLNGRPVFGDDGKQARYTAKDSVIRAFGFMPLGPSKQTQARWDARQARQYWTDRKSDMLARFRIAKDRKEALQEIKQFNRELRKAPGGVLVPPITIKTLRQALKSRPDRREMAYQR